MAKIRKPFQGVLNIIRFNWHFYVIALGLIIFLILISKYVREPFQTSLYILSGIALGTILISLLTSFYVYDLSGLYNFKWIDFLQVQGKSKIVNINAGFDEFSKILQAKFKDSDLTVLDFYNPSKHTEVSLRRARKAYPPYPNTVNVKTNNLPLEDNMADKVFAIFSAHEIRGNEERASFFKELKRITKPNGQIIITEHLQDFANFLAYNIGFFHFHSKATWLRAFSSSGLTVTDEIKINPFITTFILEKNGIAS